MDSFVGTLVIISAILGGLYVLYAFAFGQQSIFDVIRSFRRKQQMQTDPAFLPYGTNRTAFEDARRHLGSYDNELVLREMERVRPRTEPVLGKSFMPSGSDSGLHPFDASEALLVKGEALLYLGNKEAVTLFRQVIDLLEPFAALTEADVQKKELFIGRAYNDIGYFYTRIKDFPTAEQIYKEQALPRLRISANRSAYAHTLKNLGYLYGQQGRIVAAEILCQEAIGIFQDLNDRSGEAYSINTLGLVSVEARQHQVGRTRCELALKIFEALGKGEERGFGLACIGVGYSLRRLGSRDVYSLQESETILRKSISCLERAFYIFENVIKEPFRKIEACSELGCSYRDLAKVQRRLLANPSEIKDLETKALEQLNLSVGLAPQYGLFIERADALEDIAEIYFQQLEYTTALQKLRQAEVLVPKEYVISVSSGPPKIENPITPFWAVLGKICLLRGQIDMERDLHKEAYKWWAFAGSYFDLYAPTTTLTNYAVRTIYGKLRMLKIDQLEEWRSASEQVMREFRLPEPKLKQILDDIFGVIREGNPNAISPIISN